MTASQVAEWLTYSELEPFGSAHDGMQFGMVCATIANFSQMMLYAKNKKMFGPDDFIPNFVELPKAVEQKKQTPEEMKALLMGIGKSNKKRSRKR